jgi:tetratricopeptide (TPR) repeat protein
MPIIDFTGLLLPLFVVASLVSGVAITDLQSLYIDAITVPESMQQRGYTPLVFIRMMNDDLLEIEATAKTRTDAQKLRTETDKGVVAVALDMLNMTALVRAMQESGKLIEFTVNGEIVENDKDYILRLRIARYGHNTTPIMVTKPAGSIHELAAAGAERIMKITDPQVFCAAVMQDEARTQDPAKSALRFPKTQDCIAETLPTAQDDDHLWLLNLQGVVAFVEGRQEEAAKRFRAALRRQPDFPPALLNLGILQARNGRWAKAIGYFQKVVEQELPADSPQVYAAAYTEWGDALAKLGQYDDAARTFDIATKADPKYAEAYFRWAAHTSDPQEAARLTALGKAIEQRYGGLYTDNMIGKLRQAAAGSADQGATSSPNFDGGLGDTGLLAEPAHKGGTLFDRILSVWRNL